MRGSYDSTLDFFYSGVENRWKQPENSSNQLKQRLLKKNSIKIYEPAWRQRVDRIKDLLNDFSSCKVDWLDLWMNFWTQRVFFFFQQNFTSNETHFRAHRNTQRLYVSLPKWSIFPKLLNSRLEMSARVLWLLTLRELCATTLSQGSGTVSGPLRRNNKQVYVLSYNLLFSFYSIISRRRWRKRENNTTC